MDVVESSPKHRSSRRRWLVLAALLCLLVPYVVSYFCISRKYWAEWRAAKAPGFLYMSPSEATAPGAMERESPTFTRHRNLYIFYYPIQQLDQACGGPGYILCLTCWLKEIGEPKRK